MKITFDKQADAAYIYTEKKIPFLEDGLKLQEFSSVSPNPLNEFEGFGDFKEISPGEVKKTISLNDSVNIDLDAENKTLGDFFAFYSELEVMDAVYKIFNEMPIILKSDNNPTPDFLLKKNKLIIEVKTPLQTKNGLFDYITEWDNQKQIKNSKDKSFDYTSILIVNTKYSYSQFENFSNFRTNKKIYWDFCIAYNNLHNLGDIILLNKNIPENKKEELNKLLYNLKGEQIYLLSMGWESLK